MLLPPAAAFRRGATLAAKQGVCGRSVCPKPFPRRMRVSGEPPVPIPEFESHDICEGYENPEFKSHDIARVSTYRNSSPTIFAKFSRPRTSSPTIFARVSISGIGFPRYFHVGSGCPRRTTSVLQKSSFQPRKLRVSPAYYVCTTTIYNNRFSSHGSSGRPRRTTFVLQTSNFQPRKSRPSRAAQPPDSELSFSESIAKGSSVRNPPTQQHRIKYTESSA